MRMVALRRNALLWLCAAVPAVCALASVQQGGAAAPVAARALPVLPPGPVIRQAAVLSEHDTLFGTGPRLFRAGVFQMPALDLSSLPGDGLRGRVMLASLPGPAASRERPYGMVPDDGFEPEMPGDPIRDGLKQGAEGWPEANRDGKGDLAPSSVASGKGPADGEGASFGRDPFIAAYDAPPMARLSRQLSPVPDGMPDTFRPSRLDAGLAADMAERLRLAGADPGGADGAVPIDHSRAPRGGTSPAAGRPDLAAIDRRTTGFDGAAPIELAVAIPDPVITMTAVHPTTEEDRVDTNVAPDPFEGLTVTQKNNRIAGMPGLDDGVARPLTLPPVAFTKAQTCLATAVYFEARSESERGQVAVAQVVVNRVRSPFYPKNVCDVVYQGASSHRYGGCQFSFTCDLVRDRVTEPAAWAQALGVAQRVLDAEEWLPEIGSATHYHATYVRPRWVRDMVEKDKIGRHVFYRVRWWG